MLQKPVSRLDKVFLIAFCLFGCFVLWSPWTGTTMPGTRTGPKVWEITYGCFGYYSVEFKEGDLTAQIELTNLIITIAATLLITFCCHRFWLYGRLIQ